MKKLVYIIVILVFSYQVQAQFDVEDYKEYLKSHKDMSFEELLKEYPTGKFYSSAPTDFKKSYYADSIISTFEFTDYEIELMDKNSFMVSERLDYYTFIHAFWDIYKKDLPLYISSDAILHALHYSFGSMLKETEKYQLYRNLDTALLKMKDYTSNFSNSISSEEYQNAVKDFDVYITVANNLMHPDSLIKCYFIENEQEVENILTMIENLQPVEYKLFSSKERKIDFSQFKPRGHYVAQSQRTEVLRLEYYFKTMMWLGRTEIQLTNPENEQMIKHTPKDLQRMTILSALLCEASFESNAEPFLKEIEEVLTYFLGTQDNINLWEIRDIMINMNITSIDLANQSIYEQFREKVFELNSANQLYNSQILYSDNLSPDQVIPPSVFLLMGQRPIIDGFITANVVYDRVMFNDKKVLRMVPNTLDILFALGNDATLHLLEPELRQYHYSSNLASLRYLINGYDQDYWENTSYATWLNSIRSLNPPLERENLPLFMQTASWWQKTMNTQLAAWSELRHDFLLYAKQPYTSSYLCSYPKAFIEPNPEFYTNIKKFWEGLSSLNIGGGLPKHWLNTCDTLVSMSNKILKNEEFSEEEIKFYKRAISDASLCDPHSPYIGWYPNLYYKYNETNLHRYKGSDESSTEQDKFTVADVHTIPTDESGNDVGWVLHAGTGRINLATITSDLPSGKQCSYVGPVYSYYEFISNDFKRLTNQEWREMDGAAPASRPNFTKLYMADKNGNKPTGEYTSLYLKQYSDIEDELPKYNNQLEVNIAPNPFSNRVIFSFYISKEMTSSTTEFSIYDINGNLVKNLINQPLFNNNYSIIWDGTNKTNELVSQGIYIYSIRIGEHYKSGTVTLVK